MGMGMGINEITIDLCFCPSEELPFFYEYIVSDRCSVAGKDEDHWKRSKETYDALNGIPCIVGWDATAAVRYL